MASKDIAANSLRIAVIAYINSKIPKDLNKAKFGVVSNNKSRVTTTNGKTYNLTPATDMFYNDGDRIVCLIPDSGRTAAFVGKVF